MIVEKDIDENGIKYELRGEQYFPMLEISKQKNHEIGTYIFILTLSRGNKGGIYHPADGRAFERPTPGIDE